MRLFWTFPFAAAALALLNAVLLLPARLAAQEPNGNNNIVLDLADLDSPTDAKVMNALYRIGTEPAVTRMLLQHAGRKPADLEKKILDLMVATPRGKRLSRWCYFALTGFCSAPAKYLPQYFQAAEYMEPWPVDPQPHLRPRSAPPDPAREPLNTARRAVLDRFALTTSGAGAPLSSSIAWSKCMNDGLLWLKKHPDHPLTSAWLASAGELNGETAARLGAVLTDPNQALDHRLQAAELLGGLGEFDKSFEVLAQNLQNDDPVIRAACLRALGRLGLNVEYYPAWDGVWPFSYGQAHHGAKVVPLLADGLKAADPRVRAAGLEGLASLGAPGLKLLPTLCRLQQQEKDPAVRAALPGAVVRLRDPAALEFLTTALQDDDPAVRAAAVDACGRLLALAAQDPILRDQASTVLAPALAGRLTDLPIVAARLPANVVDLQPDLKGLLPALELAAADPAQAATRLVQLQLIALVGPPAAPALTRLLQTMPPTLDSPFLPALFDALAATALDQPAANDLLVAALQAPAAAVVTAAVWAVDHGAGPAPAVLAARQKLAAAGGPPLPAHLRPATPLPLTPPVGPPPANLVLQPVTRPLVPPGREAAVLQLLTRPDEKDQIEALYALAQLHQDGALSADTRMRILQLMTPTLSGRRLAPWCFYALAADEINREVYYHAFHSAMLQFGSPDPVALRNLFGVDWEQKYYDSLRAPLPVKMQVPAYTAVWNFCIDQELDRLQGGLGYPAANLTNLAPPFDLLLARLDARLADPAVKEPVFASCLQLYCAFAPTRAAEAQLRGLLAHPDLARRRLAVQAILTVHRQGLTVGPIRVPRGALADSQPADDLLNTALTAADPTERALALTVVAALGGCTPPIAALLVTRTRQEPDALVLTKLVGALAASRQPACAAGLLALYNGPNAHVAMTAHFQLAPFLRGFAADSPARLAVADMFAAELALHLDAPLHLRADLVRIFELLGPAGKPCVPLLQRRLAAGSEPAIFAEDLRLVAALGPVAADCGPLLVDYMEKHHDSNHLPGVAHALVKIHCTSAAAEAALLRLCESIRPDMAKAGLAAVQALKFSSPAAAARLRDLRDHAQDDSVRTLAAAVLKTVLAAQPEDDP